MGARPASNDKKNNYTDHLSQPPAASSFANDTEGWVLFSIAVAFSIFQIATAAHIVDLASQVTRAIHVGFLLLLSFPLIAKLRGLTIPYRVLAWILGVIGFAVALYQYQQYEALILRAGDPTQTDINVGAVSLALLFLATAFLLGPALAVLAGLFLAYCLFGHLLPSPLNHRGYPLDQVIDHMAFGTEGIYGIPTLVSSTYIFLFILFGVFLERAGMIKLFTDIALGLVGRAQGGAGKVSVVSSSLMGTISGSGVANVVTTGQFTIPLMKRFGYGASFAGGVEATASMGGQIMPPVMGAVAFIMAETLGVAYIDVVKAAIVPALLYFLSAFWMVHLEAGRRDLQGLQREEIPSALAALKAQWHLLVPLVALVALLFSGYTPLFAGTAGLALTVLLILAGSVFLRLPEGALRSFFWIGLGLIVSAFFKFGLWVVGVALLGLGIWCFTSHGGRNTLLMIVNGLAEGARTALPVGVACAIVGIIIGTMTLTGAATTFGGFIVSIGEQSLFLSLLLTMLTCLILGMGIPTIPNYIITSSLAGPALLDLGVPLIVSHMFVFYFGILADLTPPVALACFAAAPIARAGGLQISLQAVKIASAGFVIPFMAVYAPILLLQESGSMVASFGFPLAATYVIGKTVLALLVLGCVLIGYFKMPLTLLERALGLSATMALVTVLDYTDLVGFGLIGIALLIHLWRFYSVGKTP